MYATFKWHIYVQHHTFHSGLVYDVVDTATVYMIIEFYHQQIGLNHQL